mmetsp:Transcript_30749/g.50035  ORF Transcript_30749/g.50035 Transcript_30749/m.50035 type:complete len:305 (+) Transcript_30749:902-1816(+)
MLAVDLDLKNGLSILGYGVDFNEVLGPQRQGNSWIATVVVITEGGGAEVQARGPRPQPEPWNTRGFLANVMAGGHVHDGCPRALCHACNSDLKAHPEVPERVDLAEEVTAPENKLFASQQLLFVVQFGDGAVDQVGNLRFSGIVPRIRDPHLCVLDAPVQIRFGLDVTLLFSIDFHDQVRVALPSLHSDEIDVVLLADLNSLWIRVAAMVGIAEYCCTPVKLQGLGIEPKARNATAVFSGGEVEDGAPACRGTFGHQIKRQLVFGSSIDLAQHASLGWLKYGASKQVKSRREFGVQLSLEFLVG